MGRNDSLLKCEILSKPTMEIKKLIRKYYDAYLSRDLSIVKELLDHKFQALSSMMKFRTAQEFLDGSWKNSDGLIGLEYELEVVDEINKSAFYVLKWDFGKSTMHTAEYVEVKEGKLSKIMWINMQPDFYTQLTK